MSLDILVAEIAQRKIKYEELSANTVAFISCIHSLTMNDMVRPAFLERELMGLGVDGYW